MARSAGVFAGDDAAATLHASSCAVAVAPRGLADEEWTPVNRIGVGLNAGAEAHQALALAVALAADCGASLAVRTVVAAPIAYADLTAYDGDWLERSKAVAKRAAGRGHRATCRSRSRATWRSARRWTSSSSSPATVDLLVVGSRAWGPVRRTVIGSTAAKLMRKAHCPVLVLPRGAATGQPGEKDPAPAQTEATTAA